MHSARHNRGFTLIELLVTISIIAVLTVIGLVSFSTAGAKARDSKRKDDLRNVAQALEIYLQANKHYPRTAAAYTSANLSSSGGSWINDNGTAVSPITLDSNYIKDMPVDPRPTSGNPFTGLFYTYGYWSGSVSGGNCPVDALGGQYFILVATLENQNDNDRNAIKAYKRCDGVQIIPSGTNDTAFIYTSPQ